SAASPGAKGGSGFSGRGLRRLFGRFIEHRIHKRQLRRSDVPHIWRWAPLSVLELLMGRMLVLKAFKPLTAHISTPAAACVAIFSRPWTYPSIGIEFAQMIVLGDCPSGINGPRC